MKLAFLWEEDKTRNLFKTHLYLFLIGGIVASIYTLLLPATVSHRFLIIFIPAIFTFSCLIYLILLPRPNPQFRFLIFTLESQLMAAIFMALTGGFLGIVQFAPYMFLLFAVFELGAQATLILGSFSVLTFIGVLLWILSRGMEPHVLQDFFYYVGSYILIVVIENNIGKELSLQFEAKRKLEQIDDLKNQFITLASHYLRTPLTVIKAFVQEMASANPNNQQKQDIQKVDISIAGLENLVEKLLIISSIEKGQTKIILIPSHIDTVLTGIISQFQPLANKQNITLSYLPFPQPIPQFSFDPVKIKEVISSLLDNAIKYNKPGGKVQISTNVQANQVIIQISDTGLGIKKDNLPTLFSTFSRGSMEKALSFDRPGMGLSLYVAKLIISAHKGNISVSSVENQGSIFTITLPLKS